MKVLQVRQLPETPTKAPLAQPEGVTLSIYLQPHHSPKKGGHSVVIRATANKKHVYLPTGLFAEKKEFNEIKKVLIHPEKQEKLTPFFASAVALAAENGSNIDAIKAGWDKVRLTVKTDIHVKSFLEEHDNYTLDEMLVERERLEVELVKLNEMISLYSAHLKRPTKKAAATQLEKQEFERAMDEFQITWKLFSKRDRQSYSSWLTILREAAKVEKQPLTFNGITLDFYAAYANHILFTRNNYDNTFGAHVKRLKAFLKFAEQRSYPVNQAYKDRRFKIYEEQKEVFYLDETEMNRLWDLAEANPFLTKAIHLATFQNLTGLRVSDVMKQHVVTKEKGKEFLKGKCQKTEGEYTIPLALDNRIKLILELYDYDLRIISEKHYNEQIKKAVAASYTSNGLEIPEVEVRPMKQGVAYPYMSKKHLELSSHSMRRSFCTRHINGSDFNQNDILKMLGSKDLKELQKYMLVETDSLVIKAENASRK